MLLDVLAAVARKDYDDRRACAVLALGLHLGDALSLASAAVVVVLASNSR